MFYININMVNVLIVLFSASSKFPTLTPLITQFQTQTEEILEYKYEHRIC